MDSRITELITKHIANTITDEESALLEQWRGESENNEKEFRELLAVSALSDAVLDPVVPDKEKVWHLLKSRINPKTTGTYSRRKLFAVACSVAAVFSIMYISAFLLYTHARDKQELAQVTVKSPEGQKTEVALPDGSRVWLNSGTTLSYDTNFNRRNRDVELEGEAYFDVVRKDKTGFNVISGGTRVKVLGTEFNVRSYQDEKYVDVSLSSGHVEVETLAGYPLADLVPGRKVRIDKQTYATAMFQSDAELESIWRHDRLRLENEDIYSVVKKLEHWYDVRIKIEGRPTEERYWTTIKNESLGETLQIISKVSKITYKIEGEEVTITYK